jgi:hypothetical protein
MPTLKEDELAAAIAAGETDAITLDTSIFYKYGNNLRNKVLLGLKQFVGTSISVVFSDIIVSEVKGHISSDAAKTTVAVLKELKNHRQAWDHAESVEELGASAHLNDYPDELAERLWSMYVATIQATIIAADDLIRINDLTARYFSACRRSPGLEKRRPSFPTQWRSCRWRRGRSVEILNCS